VAGETERHRALATAALGGRVWAARGWCEARATRTPALGGRLRETSGCCKGSVGDPRPLGQHRRSTWRCTTFVVQDARTVDIGACVLTWALDAAEAQDPRLDVDPAGRPRAATRSRSRLGAPLLLRSRHRSLGTYVDVASRRVRGPRGGTAPGRTGSRRSGRACVAVSRLLNTAGVVLLRTSHR
jgi:hypothetical protein